MNTKSNFNTSKQTTEKLNVKNRYRPRQIGTGYGRSSGYARDTSYVNPTSLIRVASYIR